MRWDIAQRWREPEIDTDQLLIKEGLANSVTIATTEVWAVKVVGVYRQSPFGPEARKCKCLEPSPTQSGVATSQSLSAVASSGWRFASLSADRGSTVGGWQTHKHDVEGLNPFSVLLFRTFTKVQKWPSQTWLLGFIASLLLIGIENVIRPINMYHLFAEICTAPTCKQQSLSYAFLVVK